MLEPHSPTIQSVSDTQEPADGSGPSAPDSETARARDHWNRSHVEEDGGLEGNFLNHPMVQTYISLRAHGTIDGHLKVLIAELRNRTAPGDQLVSVGCGLGDKERVLARALPDRHFLGLDFADSAVAQATGLASADGLTNLSFRVGDFNALELERSHYRAVLGLGAIHHVENLEGFWAAAAEALTPDGLLFAEEYVGPNRLQWTDAQLEAASTALRELVPEPLKPMHQIAYRPKVERMLAIDPSEAVRSAEILPTLDAAGYELLGAARAGCALLQPVLINQIGAYDPRNWEHNLVLSRLFEREDQLIRDGVLGHDFVGFVARPPR